MSIELAGINKIIEEVGKNFTQELKSKDIEKIDIDGICDKALECAKCFKLNQFRVRLDYTRTSVSQLNTILTSYGKLAETKADIENGAFLFGVYLGETILENSLREKGFYWSFDPNENMPCLTKDGVDFIYPIERIHKKICDVKDDIAVFYVTSLLLTNDNLDYKKLRNM